MWLPTPPFLVLLVAHLLGLLLHLVVHLPQSLVLLLWVEERHLLHACSTLQWCSTCRALLGWMTHLMLCTVWCSTCQALLGWMTHLLLCTVLTSAVQEPTASAAKLRAPWHMVQHLLLFHSQLLLPVVILVVVYMKFHN
jgi:hypothetical protein